jgi:hypothetical protein
MARWTLALLLPLMPCVKGLAQGASEVSPEQRGLEIAEEADRRDRGFGDSVTEIVMRLISDDGRVNERRLTWQILENPDPEDGDKSLTQFEEPRDIAGTAFLTHTHIGEEDDQWLYLPSLKRVKRIASVNKTSAFVGSELAYEDLLSDEVQKFGYRWLRDEACGDETCFVLERQPRYANSGYSRQVLWMDQSEYRTHRIDFYDLDGTLEKTLTLADYRLYLDSYWRAHEYLMENHQTGKRTALSFGPYEFRTGLTDQALDPSALRRLR